MAVRTGGLTSSTPGKALYDLIAIDLAANANWSRPANNPTVSGATDSYGANYTSQIWKCTVGSDVFHIALSYDTTTNVSDLFVTAFEAWDGSDGGGVPGAKKLRRPMGGGTVNTTDDNTSVTPGATDVVSNSDVSIPSTNPNVATTNVLLQTSVFSYLYKVGNKTLTIGVNVSAGNRWVHVGAMESLVTSQTVTMPLGLFVHGNNNPVPKAVTVSATVHADGVLSRDPGLGTTAETGAFYARLEPLHMPGLANAITNLATSGRSFGASVPRWYTKVLMSQAVAHQSRNAGTTHGQVFFGYYPDLFAGVINGTTEPVGGGVDLVVIDGVTYYWLGAHCPGTGRSGVTSGSTILVAVRAD